MGSSCPIQQVGFACVLSDGSLTTNHGFILRSLTESRLAEAVSHNLDDLEKILFLSIRGRFGYSELEAR